MALIPSESYSFPDHFTRTVTPSPKPKEEKVEAPPKKPKIVALPDPAPMLIEQESQFFAEEQPMEMMPPPIKPPRPKPPPPIAPVRTRPAPMLIKQESQFFAEEQPIEPVQPMIESLPPKPARRVEPFRPQPPPAAPVALPVRPKQVQPNPAMLRATAPPPKIPDAPVRKMPFPSSLKPKVRWNHRAPATDPAPVRQDSVESAPGVPPPNIIPMQPKAAPAPPMRPVQPPSRPAPTARPAPPPPAMRETFRPAAPPPKPAPAVAQKRPVQAKPVVQKSQLPVAPNPQADFFEAFAESQEAAMRRRQQMKFRRFIACEVAALVVLVPLVILGLTLNITAPAVRWLMNAFTIAAAISAAVIPIVFYAFTPTLPELER
jgi:hypothetical protein